MQMETNGLNTGDALPVMEMFYSVQGEGYNTGKPASFVRIGGCDVGCQWCDVKESWDAASHQLTSVDSILEFVLSQPARSVVITGGEPLMYNLDKLCRKLKEQKISIFLETSGVYPLSGAYDWICVSPKVQSVIRQDMLQLADELKVIVNDEHDFQWAERNRIGVKEKCLLYLQPQWGQHKRMMPLIIDYILKNPWWMISIQSHKYMQIP